MAASAGANSSADCQGDISDNALGPSSIASGHIASPMTSEVPEALSSSAVVCSNGHLVSIILGFLVTDDVRALPWRVLRHIECYSTAACDGESRRAHNHVGRARVHLLGACARAPCACVIVCVCLCVCVHARAYVRAW